VLGRLFQKFEQADTATARKYGGAGLGLAICKNIVAVMGGRIDASSEPGGQCVPRVSAAERGAQQPALPTEMRRPHAARLAVLCAEDGATNQIILRELLGDMGHAVTIAEDGIAALELLAAHDYDLVIMDGRMPRLDGLATLQRLRAGQHGVRDANLPVIALTANASAEDRQRFLVAGASGFLPKPINESDLHAEIARHIDALLAQGKPLVGEQHAIAAGAPPLAELDAMFGVAHCRRPARPSRTMAASCTGPCARPSCWRGRACWRWRIRAWRMATP
jgi:CheY-like chemotaxis protein